ncbi:MAG: DUF885 domain-containing protein [Mycobacteriales bacterium]|nr:MAG: DUF885 domain-containing protein [Pseudonocardiales bacterium]
MTHIDVIADGHVEKAAALDPCTATMLGIAGHDDALTDYGPDGWTARAELNRETLRAVAGASAENDVDECSRSVMTERLGLELELVDAGLLQAELNVIASPLQALRMVFDLMPTDGDDAAATIATRLEAVPEALGSYVAGLRQGARTGTVAAMRQVRRCAAMCDEWSGAANGGFYAGLAERASASGAADGTQRRLQAASVAAAEATARFAEFLRTELAPLAPERDAVGRDAYALWSRLFLGSTIDLDETYAWGWEELARIDAEIDHVVEQIAPGGTLQDAMAALGTDPARRLRGPEALRGWMQRLADRVVGELAGTHFTIPEPGRALECCIAPTHDGGIYYTPPAEDFSRPGRMWWALPEGVEEFSTWREATTVFHEGVPGHHLQNVVAMSNSDLNRFRRFCWVSGHGEGWALYAERLMEELGYLDDPGDRLGMLDGQAFRAARVIVDIGMHLELPIPAGVGFGAGERWTPELGLQFLRAHCTMDDAFIRDERDRYLGWPGQAPSYKVGERLWLQARQNAQRRLGSAFDLKAFHQSALSLGSMGLAQLRIELNRSSEAAGAA